MKYTSLLLLFTLASCQDYNSNSGDRGRYGTIELSGDSQFVAAYGVIQNRCVSCHDHVHDRWADLNSNAEWIAEGVVVPGSSETSDLIQRTVNTGATASNMPPGGSPLPTEEYKILVDWVKAMPAQ